jgi:DNA-binding transcriptional MerR regulator
MQDRKYIPTSKVAERYGCSTRTIERRTEAGLLPKPHYFNGYKYWVIEELDAADDARASEAAS